MSSFMMKAPSGDEFNLSDTMSDFEETNLSWLTRTPCQKRKKDRKRPKCKTASVKTDEAAPKKKKRKSSKNKEWSAEKKPRKRDKRKTNELSLDAAEILQTSTPRSRNDLRPDRLTPGSKRKSKRKKVAFELSPCTYRIKRPNLASPSPPRPTKAVPSEPPAPPPAEHGDGASCSEPRQHGSSSQCPSEDAYSQDLFITQKTFRASPLEPSSEEYSASTATPRKFLQSFRMKQHLLELPSHQHGSKTAEHEEKSKAASGIVKDKFKKGKLVFRSEVTLDQASAASRHLSEPIDLECFGKLTGPSHSVRSTSTQTENLFTSDLTSYLDFCKKAQMAGLSGDFRPLDLSLPDRARKDLRTRLSAKMSSSQGRSEGDGCRDPSGATEEVKEDHSCPVQYCENTKSKGETTANSLSESESRSGDAFTSSEDLESHRQPDKLKVTQQVRAVQMRLNESFFFKAKGTKDGPRPRSQSPLMQLAQSKDVKRKKRR